MEDVLKVFHRDFDDGTVPVCMDESSKQLTRETRAPLPTRPRPAGHLRFRIRAQRRGEPVHGARFACGMARSRGDGPPRETRFRASSPEHGGCPCPGQEDRAGDGQPEHAQAVRSLQGLPRRRGLAPRGPLRSSPHAQHGSWLNMAEIEIGVLSRQCLARRIPDHETLERETAAWRARRSTVATLVDWRFRTEDARVKLKSLYPTIPC